MYILHSYLGGLQHHGSPPAEQNHSSFMAHIGPMTADKTKEAICALIS